MWDDVSGCSSDQRSVSLWWRDAWPDLLSGENLHRFLERVAVFPILIHTACSLNSVLALVRLTSEFMRCRSVSNVCLLPHPRLPQSWNPHRCKSAAWPERGNWPKPSCPDETDIPASWIWAETACGWMRSVRNTTNKSFLHIWKVWDLMNMWVFLTYEWRIQTSQDDGKHLQTPESASSLQEPSEHKNKRYNL